MSGFKHLLSAFVATVLLGSSAASASAADWTPMPFPDDPAEQAHLGYGKAVGTAVGPHSAYFASVSSEFDGTEWREYLELSVSDVSTGETTRRDRVDVGSMANSARIKSAPAVAEYGNGACVATNENPYGGYADPTRLTLRCFSGNGPLTKLVPTDYPNGFTVDPDNWIDSPQLVNIGGVLYAAWYEGGNSSTVFAAKWTGTAWTVVGTGLNDGGRAVHAAAIGGRLAIISQPFGSVSILAPDGQSWQQLAPPVGNPNGTYVDISGFSQLDGRPAIAVWSGDDYFDRAFEVYAFGSDRVWRQLGGAAGVGGDGFDVGPVLLTNADDKLIATFGEDYAWNDPVNGFQNGTDLLASVWRPNANEWTRLPSDSGAITVDGWYGARVEGTAVVDDQLIVGFQAREDYGSEALPLSVSSYPLSAIPADASPKVPPAGAGSIKPPAPELSAVKLRSSKLMVRKRGKKLSISTVVRVRGAGVSSTNCRGKIAVTIRVKKRLVSSKSFKLRYAKDTCFAAVNLSVARSLAGKSAILRLRLSGVSDMTAPAATLTREL